MNFCCMGMALSSHPDRPTGKPGFVARFRMKLGWHNHGHGSKPDRPSSPRTPDNTQRFGANGNVVEPPRSGTFARQQSEIRERLRPAELSPTERRRMHFPSLSSGSLPAAPTQSVPAPEAPVKEEQEGDLVRTGEPAPISPAHGPIAPPILPPTTALPADSVGGLSATDDDVDGDVHRSLIDDELDWKWILNLSMHFRDQSDREKFFVTYAETPTLRRRLTVSCDYRDAVEGTLERELATLKYQRDKSAKIFDAIRDSLTDIQFYDTITNLKLQTSSGRLHVHVTEDLHEIIQYPPVIAIAHLRCPKYKESELEFDSHLSGFVYKVKVNGEVFIKKEIPGPDTVDEFLYEINALYALGDSNHVIRFGGCVVDERRQKVKGLLISFASKGALIDIIFHERGRLPWKTREKWAKQIVSGLSEVHEAGYVQGDFTLSNIVIDENDDAKIIDINRRGCPVGWEPPEVTAMIDGLQRIGMYIGVKSDIFQLGMVLWGIAHELDEPEAIKRPLDMGNAPNDVPRYFREIVEACLSEQPQGRPSAKDLIGLFPDNTQSSRPHSDGVPRYGEGNGAFPADGGRGFLINGHMMGPGQPHDDDVRENSSQSMSEVDGNSNIHAMNGLLLNGKLPRSSTSTYIPHAPPDPLTTNAEHPDTFELAPQVIEASPSEASGDEPYLPSITGSIIGIPPDSIHPPPPPPAPAPASVPFERPPLERYSTANDRFGDDVDWMRFIPPSNPPNGHARGLVSKEGESSISIPAGVAV